MAYVSKIKTLNGTQTIGGNIFDDTWVYNQKAIATSVTIEATGVKTYSLSSCIPDDGYDYEVQLFVYLTTGATSGNAVDAQIFAGSSTTGIMRRATRCLTRTSSTQISAGTVELPISASDRAFTIKNGDGSGNGTFEIYFSGYRRIGTNGKNGSCIEKIKTPHHELTVGGNILDGKPISKNATLLSSVSISAGGTNTVSLSSYLPNDGCDYFCYFNLTNYTPATSGASNTLRLCAGTGTSTNRPVCRVVARSGATRICAGNMIMRISASDRNVTVYNSGGGATNTTTLYLRAYKRIGTNKLSNGNYISKINDNYFGGNIANGQWAYKNLTIFNATAFASQTEGDKTYTITNYLPTNNELYEVLFRSYSRTGANSGDTCAYWINGNGVSASQVASYVNTRTASNECDGKSGRIFLKQNSSGQATISMDMTSSTATGNCGLYLVGYRRLGTNA